MLQATIPADTEQGPRPISWPINKCHFPFYNDIFMRVAAYAPSLAPHLSHAEQTFSTSLSIDFSSERERVKTERWSRVAVITWSFEHYPKHLHVITDKSAKQMVEPEARWQNWDRESIHRKPILISFYIFSPTPYVWPTRVFFFFFFLEEMMLYHSIARLMRRHTTIL